jgi:hypothetical protein
MQPNDNDTPPARPAPDARALEGKALAKAKRDRMRRRAGRIRRTIAASSAALFVAAFLGVYVQLASGNDPALVAASKRSSTSALSAATASEKATSASATETSSGETESGTSEESSSSAAESESSPSSVTTSQS